MGPYTALQLLEIFVFAGVAIFGVVATPHHPTLALFGIGLLVAKGMMNALPPRYSVLLRSIAGYSVGLALAGIMVLVIRFLVH